MVETVKTGELRTLLQVHSGLVQGLEGNYFGLTCIEA